MELERIAALVICAHQQRMDHRDLGLGEPLRQIVRREFVHEKSDGAAVHAVDRLARLHEPVQGLQHEAVAAERDDHVGGSRSDVAVTGGEPLERLLCLRDGAGDEGYPFVARFRGAHGLNYRRMIGRWRHRPARE
jgi:hypothetical protein